jgi:serine/threonine protein kinase
LAGEVQDLKDEFGVELDHGSFSGRSHPDYNTPDLNAALGDCAAILGHPSTRILEESRNRVGVARIALDEKRTVEVVIKEFRTVGVEKIKSLFQSSKARRAWRGSLALTEAGLGTSHPIAYLEKRRGSFLDQSYFLSEYISDTTEIRILFRELSSDALDRLLEELALFLSRCTRAGIYHRDLSDGNILVRKSNDEQNQFFLLDTNRIRLKKKVGSLRGIKSLIRLGIPLDRQRSFLSHYTHRSSINGWPWLWYRLNKVSYTNYVALKRALGLRKIAQKLKIQ